MVDLLDKYVLAINDVLWTYVIVALLIVAGLYFTIRSRFVQFRFIKEMFRLLGEGMGKKTGFHRFRHFVSVRHPASASGILPVLPWQLQSAVRVLFLDVADCPHRQCLRIH